MDKKVPVTELAELLDVAFAAKMALIRKLRQRKQSKAV